MSRCSCTAFVNNLTRILQTAFIIGASSRIYRGPQAEPDDMGNVSYDLPVLLARLDHYTGFEQARLN